MWSDGSTSMCISYVHIDSIQRMAMRWGLTESFVPISEHLASKDKKLLDTLSRRQPLVQFSTMSLRLRVAPSDKSSSGVR